MRRAPTPAMRRCSPTPAGRRRAAARTAAARRLQRARRRQRAALRARRSRTDARAGSVLTNAAEKLYALRRRRARRRGRAAGAGARSAGARPRSAASPGPWSRTRAFESGAFAQRREGLRRGARADAREGCRAQRTGRAPGRVDLQAGRAARSAGSCATAVGPLRARGRRGAELERCAPHAQYDAAAALIALKDWDARDAALEDFRTPLPEASAAGRRRRQARRRLRREGHWARRRPASSSAWPPRSKDPQARASCAVAGRRAVREGRRARRGRQGLRALPQAVPRAARAGIEARYRLAQHRQGRRQRARASSR